VLVVSERGERHKWRGTAVEEVAAHDGALLSFDSVLRVVQLVNRQSTFFVHDADALARMIQRECANACVLRGDSALNGLSLERVNLQARFPRRDKSSSRQKKLCTIASNIFVRYEHVLAEAVEFDLGNW
jgi:hypothetical protein